MLRSIFPEDLVQYAGEHGLLQEILTHEHAAAPSLGATVDYMPPYWTSSARPKVY